MTTITTTGMGARTTARTATEVRADCQLVVGGWWFGWKGWSSGEERGDEGKCADRTVFAIRMVICNVDGYGDVGGYG